MNTKQKNTAKKFLDYYLAAKEHQAQREKHAVALSLNAIRYDPCDEVAIKNIQSVIPPTKREVKLNTNPVRDLLTNSIRRLHENDGTTAQVLGDIVDFMHGYNKETLPLVEQLGHIESMPSLSRTLRSLERGSEYGTTFSKCNKATLVVTFTQMRNSFFNIEKELNIYPTVDEVRDYLEGLVA